MGAQRRRRHPGAGRGARDLFQSGSRLNFSVVRRNGGWTAVPAVFQVSDFGFGVESFYYTLGGHLLRPKVVKDLLHGFNAGPHRLPVGTQASPIIDKSPEAVQGCIQ